MGSQLTHRGRARMWLPAERVVRDAFEETTRRTDLTVVLWEENVDEWHPGSG